MIEEYVSIREVDKLENISKEVPTTFIFDNPKKISKYVTGDKNSIAFRVPNNDFCIDLIESLWQTYCFIFCKSIRRKNTFKF